jgi:hypothetical protein
MEYQEAMSSFQNNLQLECNRGKANYVSCASEMQLKRKLHTYNKLDVFLVVYFVAFQFLAAVTMKI